MRRLDIIAIIQARMGSSRLSGKVLRELSGKPVLWHVVNRVGRSRLIDDIVVATTCQKRDLEIVKYCAEQGIRIFVGSENDVLDRYYQAARLYKPKHVVRITADCPLHDGKVIDMVIQKHLDMNNDYTSNTLEDSFPDGLDCEVFTFSALERAWKEAKFTSEREHVTPYIKKQESFRKCSVIDSVDHSQYRWTVDTEKDFLFVSQIFERLHGINPGFGKEEIYALLESCPELMTINQGIIRNEGYIKSIENDTIMIE